MSLEELRVITIVYVSALAPLIIYFYKKDSIPLWVPSIYLGSFLICSLGWELWFTYGWIDGDPVNVRRSEVLNTWIPYAPKLASKFFGRCWDNFHGRLVVNVEIQQTKYSSF